MPEQVRRDDEHSRYELVIDGEIVGGADFVLDGTTMVLPHTEIDPRQRGRGWGAVLVQGVLDDARARGLDVVPTCWYVREYIALHPDEADLLAS
jgi:predicted GNAT family acetyltransferase